MAAKYSKFTQGTPPPGLRDLEVIRLSRNGVWLAGMKDSDGDSHATMQEITHDLTRHLFAKSLKKDEAGYFLHIGHETKRIEVEDTAYFIERIEGTLESGFRVFINDETNEKLDPQTLKYREGRLTCRVQNGEEEAKFLSAPYIELLRLADQDQDGYFLRIEGKKIPLGPSQ